MTKADDGAWQEALAASEQGRWEEAVALWREITERDPDEAAGFTNLGTALFHAEQHDAAIAAYQDALRRDSDDAHTHSWLGSALSAVGQPDAAFEHWRVAVRLAPGHAEARYSLALALYHRGEDGAAIEQWREVVRLKPDDWMAHHALGSVYARKARKSHSRTAWRRAWAAYQQAAKLNPGQDADTLYWLGHLEWKFGSRRAAERIMKQALAVDPDNQETYAELGRMQFYQGRWRESMQTVQAATERPKFDPSAYQIRPLRLAIVLAVPVLLTTGLVLLGKFRQNRQ